MGIDVLWLDPDDHRFRDLVQRLPVDFPEEGFEVPQELLTALAVVLLRLGKGVDEVHSEAAQVHLADKAGKGPLLLTRALGHLPRLALGHFPLRRARGL